MHIATELSQILAVFGSETTIIVRNCLLSTFDQELAGFQMANFDHLGIEFQCGELARVDKNADGTLQATYTNGKKKEFDCILMAVGRTSNVEGLGLEDTDVTIGTNDVVITDEYNNTTADGVYAVGDVDGRIALTPVAIRAGRTLSERIFNNRPGLKVDYTNVPSVIFSHPPIGSVGLSEEKAVEIHGRKNISVYKTQFGSMILLLTLFRYV